MNQDKTAFEICIFFCKFSSDRYNLNIIFSFRPMHTRAPSTPARPSDPPHLLDSSHLPTPSPSSSANVTAYKSIDFVKTEAFNRTRHNVEKKYKDKKGSVGNA